VSGTDGIIRAMPAILDAARRITARDNLAAAEPVLLAAVVLFTAWKWARDRSVSVRLADARVPNNALMLGLAATRLRRQELRQRFMDLGYAMSELGNLLGEQIKQSELRAKEELQLQTSLESYARTADARDKRVSALQERIEELSMAADTRDWQMLRLHTQIVRFTYVLALLGIATIGVTVWLALR
jgi:hypothetical protein